MTKADKKMGKPSLSVVRGVAHPERVKVVGKKSEKERPLRRWGFRYEYCVRWWEGRMADWKPEERWFGTERARDQALKVFEKRIEKWFWYRSPKKVVK